MNVKTLKRFSKRSVSMLLSVLMVLSLFTVCMVGTTLTSHAYDPLPATTITVHLNGSAAQSWENVYFVIGRDQENDGNPEWTQFYQMTAVTGKLDTYTLSFSGWGKYDRYFFTGMSGVELYGTGGNNIQKKIRSDTWKAIPASLKTVDMEQRDNIFIDTHNGNATINPVEFEVEALQKESIDYSAGESILAHKTKSTKKWGTSTSGYETVYLVIGNNVDRGPETKVYTMGKNDDGTFSTPSGFSFKGAAYYFFTTISIPDDKKGSWKKIDDAYNYVTGQDAARDKVTNKFTTKLTELELTVSNKTFIDATLYNYRSSETGGLDGQIGGTINDTDEEKYIVI